MLNIAVMSAQPLDLNALARSYNGLGRIELSENRVKIEWEEGWFWIDIDSVSEEYFLEASEAELAKVYAAMGKPCLAELRYSDFLALDLAIVNFPPLEKIFLDNGGLSIFSLEEIRQRVAHRVEWVDIDGYPGGLDLIVRAPSCDAVTFVFLDGDMLGAAKRHDDLLLQRLLLCLKDVASRRFRLPYCDFSKVNKTVEVVYKRPLTENIKQVKALRDDLYPSVALPLQFLSESEFRERHGFVPRDLPSLRDRY